MARETVLTNTMLFSQFGGLNTTVHPAFLQNEFQVLRNIVRTDDRSLRKRGAQIPQSGLIASAVFRGLFDFWLDDAGTRKQFIVACGGTKIYASSDGGVNFADITGATPMVVGDNYSFAVLDDKLIICSTSSVPQVWTGTGTCTDLAGAPTSANMCQVHLGRLWMNEQDDPHQLHYTGPYDPAAWASVDGGGTLSIYENDGDPSGLTALFPSLDGEMYVSKLTKIYRITGRTRDSFAIDPVSVGIGCINHRCVVPVGLDFYFPSLRGWHALSQIASAGLQTTVQYLSSPIHTLYMETIKKGDGMRAIFAPELNSIVWAHSRDTDGINRYALCYHLDTNSWYEWTDFVAQDMMLKYNHISKLHEFWQIDNLGYCHKYDKDQHNDRGQASPIRVDIKFGFWIPGQSFAHEFNFRRLYLMIVPHGDYYFDVSYRTDLLKDSNRNFITITSEAHMLSEGSVLLRDFILGEDNLGLSKDPKILDVTLESTGRYIEISLGQYTRSTFPVLDSFILDEDILPSGVSEHFEVLGLAMEAVPTDIIQENN